MPQTTGGDIHNYLYDLFNGNTRSMLTSLPDINQYKTRNIQSHTLGFVYRYDQLNRIKEMRTFDNLNYASNQWNATPAPSIPLNGTERYFSEYNYDAMGNITHLKRIANQTYLPPGGNPIGTMDDLTYSYSYDGNNHLMHNRLDHVADAVSTAYSEDLETQAAGNYTYDETGNLITDAAEQIQNIAWNVYGKIKGITRNGGTKPELEYGYGPSGQRISKTVIPQTGGNRQQELEWKRTWYIRDASGNTMATYTQAAHENKHAITHAVINTVATFTLAEQHLYGSARLGYTELNRLMDSAVLNTPGYNSNQSFDNYTWQAVTVNTLDIPYDYAWGGNWNLLNGRGITRGYKRYELSNHLGNVLVTVSDRHLAVDVNSNTVGDYFQPFVQSIQDYFPFGSGLPGREWKVSRYRYTINTQEKEPELGDGMSSAEFWMYDGKLGRRWNVDPVLKDYEGSYSSLGNSPIIVVDYLGNDTGDVVVLFPGANVNVTSNGYGSMVQLSDSIMKYTGNGTTVILSNSKFWGVNLETKEGMDSAVGWAYNELKKNYKKGGRIVLYGYSWGGALIHNLSDRLAEDGFTVDLLVTVDAAGGSQNEFVRRNVSYNVKVNWNIYQTTPEVLGSGVFSHKTGSHGDPNGNSFYGTTKIINENLTGKIINGTKVQHGNIDDLTLLKVAQCIGTWTQDR